MKTLQQLKEAFFEAFADCSFRDQHEIWQWFEPHLSTPGTTEVDEWIKQLEMSFKQQFAYHHADDKGNHPMLPQYSAEEVFTWFYLHIKSRIQLSPSMQIGEVSMLARMQADEDTKIKLRNEFTELIQHSFKPLTDEDKESRYYLAQCSKCEWWGSSGLLHGGGAIADTGDYFDCVCPVCGNPDIDEKPSIWEVSEEEADGLKSVKSELDPIIEKEIKEGSFYMEGHDVEIDGWVIEKENLTTVVEGIRIAILTKLTKTQE